jgi:thioredoxin 1
MPKILFNYNLCDLAPECGGIEVCPNGAITYDTKQQRPVWNSDNCNFCLQCTTPDACPVGVILYARDEREEKAIHDSISKDPRTAEWLWQERYGVQPARSIPFATILTDKNLKLLQESKKAVLLDIWRENDLDCRFNSPLYSELLGEKLGRVELYRLDGNAYPAVALRFAVNTYPTLLLLQSGKELYRYEGHIGKEKLNEVSQKIMSLV